VVAILMSPLFYGTLALLLDAINLIIPAPNIVPGIGRALDKALNAPQSFSVWDWGRLAAIAALPGLIWMALLLSALQRVLRVCMRFDARELAARAPDITVLAEQRFANVAAEMAIAASVAAPRVFIADSEVMDAVAFGTDAKHATIVVSRGLLTRLDRAQMEGVAAHLIASIADGDMRIGLRAALSVSVFALVARLGSVVTNRRNAYRNLAQIVRVTLLPTAKSARQLVTELASPFEDDDRPGPPSASASRWERIRPYLWLPLAGPLVMTGFLGAIVNLFILGPLLSLAWRQRKYMADATAVRLTRDPDTLARALEQMSASRGPPLAPWASHMSVTSLSVVQQRGMLGGSAVPMFPSIDRRLRALGTMGAHVSRPRGQMPFWALAIIVPLLVVLAALVAIMLPLMVWLSAALTMLFSGLPFSIVHLLLRWLGHH
jgi:Zn-dependent protease with chaperone function